MKIIALNGSPKASGNTKKLLNTVSEVLARNNIEIEHIHVGNKPIHGCIACMQCFKNKDKHCAVKDDYVNPIIDKILAADGLIIGAPTYCADIPGTLKCLLDRISLVAKANEDMFKRKIGAAVVAVRRAGSLPAFHAINSFFLIGQMIVPGSSYWNMGIGLNPGDVENDEEGMRTMEDLGENIAWLLKKVKS